jgi:hypothetical protein
VSLGRQHGYAYHIPYRAITPKASECSNLLVPVALSCTHVGISSIRVEPTWMILGQSAGIAAAMSAKQNIAVQKLPYLGLRERLLAQKQVLDLPVLADLPSEPKGAMNINPKTLPGIVLDDTQAELKGEWSRSSSFKPHIGTGYLHDDKRGDGQSSPSSASKRRSQASMIFAWPTPRMRHAPRKCRSPSKAAGAKLSSQQTKRSRFLRVRPSAALAPSSLMAKRQSRSPMRGQTDL